MTDTADSATKVLFVRVPISLISELDAYRRILAYEKDVPISRSDAVRIALRETFERRRVLICDRVMGLAKTFAIRAQVKFTPGRETTAPLSEVQIVLSGERHGELDAAKVVRSALESDIPDGARLSVEWADGGVGGQR